MTQIFNLRKIGISLAMLAVVALGSTAVARADSITVVINNPNSGLSGTPGPYADVSLTLVTVNQGTTVCTAAAPCIQVHVANRTGFTMFGNGAGNGAFGFNVVGATDGSGLTACSCEGTNRARWRSVARTSTICRSASPRATQTRGPPPNGK